MTSRLDLGSLQLHSRTSGHCVYVHSAAEFAASEKDEFDLHSLLTRPGLTAQDDALPWVHAGRNLTLSLTIHMDDSLSDISSQEVIEVLSVRLVQAKVILNNRSSRYAH